MGLSVFADHYHAIIDPPVPSTNGKEQDPTHIKMKMRVRQPFAGSLAIVKLFAPVLTLTGVSYADLTLHTTTMDERAVSKNLDRYERHMFPRNSGIIVFVRRDPVLKINDDEIEAVTISKAAQEPDSKDRVDKSFGDLEKNKKQATQILSHEVVTFRLNDQGARKFTSFARQHIGETFALKVKSILITLPTFLEPFPESDREFALQTSLSDEELRRLKKLIPSLKIVPVK